MDTLWSGSTLRIVECAPGIAELCFDRTGAAVNTIDQTLLDELDEALVQLAARDDVRGLLLTSAKDAFIAGADITVLWDMHRQWPADQIAAFCRRMQRSFTLIEDLDMPSVCAINGFALGGGLEVALCAHFRVLADDAKVGFPEVGLGILPGAGGTVRTPRLAGLPVALAWIVGARNHRAAAALDAGVVDQLASPDALRDAALQMLRQAADGEIDWRARRTRLKGGFARDDAALAAARADLGKLSRHQPAAPAVVDWLERSASMDQSAALDGEEAVFTRLVKTPTVGAMVSMFLSGQSLNQKLRKQGGAARQVNKAAVLGAGIMGGGIAYSTAVKGTAVVLKDIAQEQLDLGIGEAWKLLGKLVAKARMTEEQAHAVLASIEPTLTLDGFDSVNVVVEAVVENLGVKQSVLAEVEAATPADTILASNTSSLAITEIASALQRPENMVGMHFFNPVHMMPLVEVIRGDKTSDQAVATAVAYVRAMGKTPLVVADCAGFLVNRLLGAYFTALNHLIRDGADFVQIDRVMETWGWPMGPCYLLDVAGLDTLDKAMKYLGAAYPDVMAPPFPTVIQTLAEAGRYGQKTGAGFYKYEPDSKGRPRRSADPEVRDLIAGIQADGARDFSDQEILDRMMLAMILEAGRCLDEHVVESAVEVDTGMRLGTGFPLHHGGPLWLADQLGLPAILERCDRLIAIGGLYVPGEGLRKKARDGSRFFDAIQA